MTARKRNTRPSLYLLSGVIVISLSVSTFADRSTTIELTAEGEKICQHYREMLEQLSSEIATKLPAVKADEKSAFMRAHEAIAALKTPKEDAGPKLHQEYQRLKAINDAESLSATQTLLKQIDPFLSEDALDAKLIRVAILRHGTPEGLAEFAQQGAEEKALLDKLFSDDMLMKEMLKSGGANGGEYGEAMQVYTAILNASDRAKEPGILHNLALGTALHQPWLAGKERGSINGLVFTDNENPDGQVDRYLHYEKAFLDGELDPAFENFSAWECRFITNDPYTNEELSWARQRLFP